MCVYTGITERCGQTLGTSSTYHSKEKCPYQHVSQTFNLWVIADFPSRGNFRRCSVQLSAEHFFVSSVLFTGDARFGRDGIIHIQNQHQWAEENPHGAIHSRQQQQFSALVWAGIVDVGPVCFATSAYSQPLPRFPPTWSAVATGICTTGSQSTNVLHAWWCSGTF
jgi:hypothetical protein